MKITQLNDKKGTFIKLDIAEADYKSKVEETLGSYRKRASIPGFRKGQVPMGLLQKQYGDAIMMEEVNKIIQHEVNTYITSNKLNILGEPIPKEGSSMDWSSKDFSFEFEIGLVPDFEVDLKKKNITQYVIDLDEKALSEHIESLRRLLGKREPLEAAKSETDEVIGTFYTEDKSIDVKGRVVLEYFEDKYKTLLLKRAKKGEVITLKTKNLFGRKQYYQNVLGISAEEANKMNSDLQFSIEEINHREPVELNQDFFDRLYGKDLVTSEAQMRDKTKEELQKQFTEQADQKLFGDTIESLIANTKINLPEKFLKRYIRETAKDKERFADEKLLNQEYEKVEKSLRYQLIEDKIVKENEVQVSAEELTNFAKTQLRKQMALYGRDNVADEEVEAITHRILENRDELRRLHSKLMSDKLLEVYKKNVSLKPKRISYKDFLEEV